MAEKKKTKVIVPETQYGNVFTGEIIHTVPSPKGGDAAVYDIVTLKIGDVEPFEITVSITRIPFVGVGASAPALQKGGIITISLPVAPAVIHGKIT